MGERRTESSETKGIVEGGEDQQRRNGRRVWKLGVEDSGHLGNTEGDLLFALSVSTRIIGET